MKRKLELSAFVAGVIGTASRRLRSRWCLKLLSFKTKWNRNEEISFQRTHKNILFSKETNLYGKKDAKKRIIEKSSSILEEIVRNYGIIYGQSLSNWLTIKLSYL